MTNMPPLKDGVCDVCGGELYQRADDNEKTIRARMQVYSQATTPIIDYYAQQHKLKKLDANSGADDVRRVVAAMLK
jgi:adenylate kinase